MQPDYDKKKKTQHSVDGRMLYIMLSQRREDHGSLIHLFKIRADFVTVTIRIYSFSALFYFSV
jgi:hypothetical protein